MFYFDKMVQDVIAIELKHIKGSENKDDARQDAYHEIADVGPLTVEDACECAKKAIHRFRVRIGRQSKREGLLDDSMGSTDKDGYPYSIPADYDLAEDDLDEDGEEIERVKSSWIDFVQPDTDRPPRHGKKYFVGLYKETCNEIEMEKKRS